MTAVAPPQSTRRADLLTFAAEWQDLSTVLITVHGDIDACNASQFAEYVFHRAANCRGMVLDMSGVEFFSTAGFARLRTIETRCARAGVQWKLIPSRAVRRVLSICDPRGSLPVEAG